MKKRIPNLIYTYFTSKHDVANVIIHDLRIYKPYRGSSSGLTRMGDNLFDIRGQSNVDTDHNRGLRRAYALRFESLPVERPESVKLAAKLSAVACTRENAFPAIVKALRKMGAVRYALGKVNDPRSYDGKEFMPRKFAGKKSQAYWEAIKNGLDVE